MNEVEELLEELKCADDYTNDHRLLSLIWRASDKINWLYKELLKHDDRCQSCAYRYHCVMWSEYDEECSQNRIRKT